jgi:putative phosphoesterase
MKVAVISDSHDNTHALNKAVDIANNSDCSWLFHLGDIISPFTAKKLSHFKGKIKAVYGNCDGERIGLLKAFNAFKGVINNPPYKFNLEGKDIVLMHEPVLLEEITKSQQLDFVFYGHLHQVDHREIGKTLILNPGESGGLLSDPTFFVINLSNKSLKKYDL